MQKVQMNTRQPKKLKERLEKLAKNKQMSLSEFVWIILQTYVDKLDKGERK